MKTPLVSAALLLLGAILPLPAETVAFPKAGPLFTVEIPDGWDYQLGDTGPLMIQNKEVTVVVVFDRALGVTDVATAKEAAAKQVQATVEQTGFTDLKAITPIKEMALNDRIAGVGAQYHANFPGGQPCIYIVSIFAPEGKNYCTAELSIKADGLLPAIEKQWSGILDSVSPISTTAKP